MKKYTPFFASILVFCCTISAQAQDLQSILTGIAKNVVGDVTTTQTSILGTWKYSAPAMKMKGENDLATIVGEVASASSVAESKLEPIYTKVGLDKCVFTFNEDGTYKTEIDKLKTSGTYIFDAENKTITFKTKMGITASATISTTGSSMTLLFNADKLMTALKTITGYVGNISKSIAAVNSLAKNYNGISLGFELKKQ